MEKIKNIVYAINPDTEIMMFMPWAFKDGVLWIAGQTDDFFAMQEKIRSNSIIMSNSIGIQIAPVGWAWYNSISQRNDIELFDPDLSHPSLAGSYLSASIFYSTFFQEEVNSNYFASLDSSIASFLQDIASATVLNDLNTWILEIENNHAQPTNFSLKQNYPNPFNSSTIIEYDIPETTSVTLSLYDLNGRQIKELDIGLRSSGNYKVQMNSDDIPSGIYFYRLTTNNFDYIKKCSLTK
jgi:hypothetical protein